MATEIKCEKKVIREIFNMWYCIPDYQRAYVWDTDQIRDLLDDTIAAYRENKDAQCLEHPGQQDGRKWRRILARTSINFFRISEQSLLRKNGQRRY